jgi:pantoate--beta-alanine ligase
MQTIASVAGLRQAVNAVRRSGKTIGFVPTMGNLHDGHLQLVEAAQRACDVVVVSIFVNPLQFGPNEDLDAYPRTMAADKQKLFAAGVHILFAPTVEEMYPRGLEPQTQVSVPGLSDILCGASRPGHFAGVATVVNKLFNMVQPDLAFFGKKDYQQLLVIQQMVADLCLPLTIVGVETTRDSDGLALSSRNGYLSAAERHVAPVLHRTLVEYRDAIASGFDNYRDLERFGAEDLRQAGFKPDYFSIRDAQTLAEVQPETEEIVLMAAARLGATRLIDNLTLSVNPASDWGMLAAN